MRFTKESAVQEAKADLAKRLDVSADEIEEKSVEDTEFRDMSLGTTVVDEMAAQMISYGWTIILSSCGEDYEYRADKYQLRLRGFNGTNHIVKS